MSQQSAIVAAGNAFGCSRQRLNSQLVHAGHAISPALTRHDAEVLPYPLGKIGKRYVESTGIKSKTCRAAVATCRGVSCGRPLWWGAGDWTLPTNATYETRGSPGDLPLTEAANREYSLRSLAALGRLPAVPYYEHRGAEYVMSACERAGLAVTLDQWGNVLATRPGTDADAPGLAFVAHLDHPGFEAVSYDGGYLMCRALGGVPPGALKAGTAVQLLTDDDSGGIHRTSGSVIAGVPVSEDAHDTPTRDRAVLVDAEERVGELPYAVVFDLPDFDLDGSMIRMRALDDLAGCASVLAVLRAATGSKRPAPYTVCLRGPRRSGSWERASPRPTACCPRTR